MRREDHPPTPVPAGDERPHQVVSPWVTAPPRTAPELEPVPPAPPAAGKAGEAGEAGEAAWPPPPLSGPPAPHRSLPALEPGAALASCAHVAAARVWWLGVHGGAGESTLSALLDGSREADHAWPDLAGEPPAVVLLARPNAHGLARAQVAAAQWASGATPSARLLGLVLIADAPGRLPAALHTWAKVLAGGVPRIWHLPWSEPLRLGEDPTCVRLPRPARRLLGDVAALTCPPPVLEEVRHDPRAAARL